MQISSFPRLSSLSSPTMGKENVNWKGRVDEKWD
jgi:hypothetical protein